MDSEEASHSKKGGRKGRHNHHSSKRPAPVPPSYTDQNKLPAAPSKGGSRNERVLGLWEFYFDEQGQEEEQLKNIRGFLLKRRKSPLKGWHKRYFVLERGILYFSRTQAQIAKGKSLGSLDLGVAFIHADVGQRRIDIDGEQLVLHLKTKNSSQFAAWSSTLSTHEMFRKAHLASGPSDPHLKKEGVTSQQGEGLEVWSVKLQDTLSVVRKDIDGVGESLDTLSGFISGRMSGLNSALATPLDTKPPDSFSDTLSITSATGASDSGRGSGGVVSDGSTKHKKGKGFRKGKSDKKNRDSSTNMQFSPEMTPISGSITQLEDNPLIIENEISRENSYTDFTAIAKLVYAQFSEILEKLKKLEDDGLPKAIDAVRIQRVHQDKVIANQQLLLKQALQQNTELKERLTHIQSIATGVDSPGGVRITTPGVRRSPSVPHSGLNIRRFGSFMSLQSSMSDKFFDALDDLHEGSSESEEEEVEDSEESDMDMYESLSHEVFTARVQETMDSSIYELARNKSITEEPGRSPDLSHDRGIKRRTKLPSPIQEAGDLSLWSILRKNIGKDLSKVSMPVSLNEPLSALQRLCEELEYSELLDQASQLDNVYDRMVHVAAFAVSSYALSYHRAGRKPFNPILGETFESVRDDKGFKFIAEQVSHHPPIAACHCDSPNFEFWQDARIKSKFWGKSMEVFPIGTVNLTLPKHNDHYQWQKVTSCIHNVLGGQRWVDQYGEMTIINRDKCSCKLTFVKASYWSNKKYQVFGDVFDSDGTAVRHLFGAWHEAIFCGDSPELAQCIWKAGPMPEDYESYYSFGQFAMELNELEEGHIDSLPCTDCRFRPDQRMLEEGRIQDAEAEKHRVEQIQRAARAERERLGEDWCPKFFTKQDEDDQDSQWVSSGDYWKHKDSKFRNISLPKLW